MMNLRVFVASLAAFGSLCLLPRASALAQSMAVAIRNVTVVEVTDGSLRSGQTVLVDGNRIRAVGTVAEVDIPPGAEIVEGAGGYLIPGLWDTHVHSVWNVEKDTDVRSVARIDWHFPLLLAHGVTGVRNMNDATADVTLELTSSVKRRLAEGQLIGPRLLANGPSIDGDPPLPSNPVVVRTAAEARAVADSLADAGADFIKVYENLPRDAYFAVMDQARRRGTPVDGHVPFRVTPEEVAEAGQRTVEHPEALAAGCSTEAEAAREEFERALSDYESLPDGEKFLAQFRYYRVLYDTWDPAACASTFETYRRNGVAVAADFAYHSVVDMEQVLSDTAGMRFVPQSLRRNWEEGLDSETTRKFQSILRPMLPLQEEQVRLFHEAGGTILAATDLGAPPGVPGISLHEELARLVEAGLTPLESLQTATLNPAHVLGLADSLGTIEAGKLADLVLLDANPLEDITNTRRIRAVVADGRLYRRFDLDRILAEVEAMHRESERQEAQKASSQEFSPAQQRVRLDAEHEMALADSILSLTRQYNAAWESLSADRISAFHADDFHYYWRGSTDASSRAEYDRLLRDEILPSMQKWSAEMRDPYVKVLGADAAVVSFEFSSDVVDAAGEPDDYGSGALTYVFERRDRAWKIVLIHESRSR